RGQADGLELGDRDVRPPVEDGRAADRQAGPAPRRVHPAPARPGGGPAAGRGGRAVRGRVRRPGGGPRGRGPAPRGRTPAPRGVRPGRRAGRGRGRGRKKISRFVKITVDSRNYTRYTYPCWGDGNEHRTGDETMTSKTRKDASREEVRRSIRE